jgi:hypothetical protein
LNEGKEASMTLAIDQNSAATTPPLERSLLAWPPYIWSHVTFAGVDPAREPCKWRSLFWLLLIPGLLLYVSMAFPLFEPDEGRYAEIPREMLAQGEWVVPYLNGEPYLDKPALLYWLVILSYKIFGIHDWAARLVPAMAVHATVLLVYLFGRRRIGERAALRGAFLLSLAPAFVTVGRLLVIDGLLSLWVTLLVFAAWEALEGGRWRSGWWLIAGLAAGLGILSKGPIALILTLPPLALSQWLQGKPIRLLSWNSLLFLLATAAVSLPWYIAICLRLPHFAGYFLWQHNLMRFLSPFDHLEPFWYYAPILLLGFLPGTLLLPSFVHFLCSGRPEIRDARGPALGFLLLAGGWCVLFFSLSGCKLPTYILPAFPFLALAVGCFWSTGPLCNRRWVSATLTMAFGVLCVGHTFVLPWYARYRGTVTQVPEVLAYCEDRSMRVVSYPRPCDSLAFYSGRDDLRSFRGKETNPLILFLLERPRTVLLLTHRHSLESLKFALPPELVVVENKRLNLGDVPFAPKSWSKRITTFMGETALGLSDVAIVERRTSTANK